MTKSWFVLLESNSTGTGQIFPQAVKQTNLQPIVFAANPDRYPFLVRDQVPFLMMNTADEDAVREAMSSLAREGLAGIYSSSEYYVEAVARLASEFRLAGGNPEAVANCRNKYHMRQVLEQHGIPVPKFRCATDENQVHNSLLDFSMPVIVKPTTGSGSVGVVLCRDRDSAATHAARILAQTRNERGLPIPREVLLEEYVAGPEFSVETFGTEVIGVTRKHLSPEPDFVEIGHDFPAAIPDTMQNELTEMVLRALRAIDLTWGPAHTEVRFAADGPRIIEINPRLAGGSLPEVVRLATGFDGIKATIELASGKKVRAGDCHHLSSSIRFIMCPIDGVLKEANGLSQASCIPGVTKIKMYRQPGDSVSIHHDFRDRIGHVIAVADSEVESASRAEEALRRISVEVEECTTLHFG